MFMKRRKRKKAIKINGNMIMSGFLPFLITKASMLWTGDIDYRVILRGGGVK